MFSQSSWQFSQDASMNQHNGGTPCPPDTQESNLSLDLSLNFGTLSSQTSTPTLTQLSEAYKNPLQSSPQPAAYTISASAVDESDAADACTAAALSILEMSQTTPNTASPQKDEPPPNLIFKTDPLANLWKEQSDLLRCYACPNSLRTATIAKLFFTEEQFGNDAVMLALGTTFLLRSNSPSYFSNFQVGIIFKTNLRCKNGAPLDMHVENSAELDREIDTLSSLASAIGKKDGRKLQLGFANVKRRLTVQLEIVYVLHHLIRGLLRHVLPLAAIKHDDCFWFLSLLMVSCPTENDCYETILKVAVATQAIQQSPLLEHLRTLWENRSTEPSVAFLQKIHLLFSSLSHNFPTSDLNSSLRDTWGLLERAGLKSTVLVQQFHIVSFGIKHQRGVIVNPVHYFFTTVVAKAVHLSSKHSCTQGQLQGALILFKTYIFERKKQRITIGKEQRHVLAQKRPVQALKSTLSNTHLMLEESLDSALKSILVLPEILPRVSHGQQSTPLPKNLGSLCCLKQVSHKDKNQFFRLWQNNGDPTTTVVTPAGSDSKIFLESVKRLRKDWLRDDIINYFFAKLQDRSRRRYDANLVSSNQLCWFFTSYFFTRAMNLEGRSGFGKGHSNPDAGVDKSGEYFNKYNYNNVRRWTKRQLPSGTNLFQIDKLAIPVNFGGVHWMLCVVFIQRKEIHIFDSLLSHKYDSCLVRSVVFQYILDEYQSVHGKPMDRTEIDHWRFADKVLNAPQQRNTRDCGVFTVLFGEYLATKHNRMDPRVGRITAELSSTC
ncbi:unnamed protein product [Cylindrotheca closterium]|uniref:Ubiquitin-like protease family profile domain-containing protein n=1 Tax=Cylindrotheca closterium TaxID=2856 RepID=A0AAD2GAB4_9STRA|nr:unnamed protein product [Cylindrotheca closterium]